MRRVVGAAVVLLSSTALLVPASPAVAGPADRQPGAPVAPVAALEQSANGGTNPQVGGLPATASLGRPDPGVVPVVGDVRAVADSGAYVRYESRVSDRVVDLMVSSPALGGSTPVRLQLPAGFDRTSGRTWPVLYLLPGASDKADYQSWSVYTRALARLAGEDVIVAMPSVGKTGLGTNWSNDGQGARGGYQWNTHLAQELPQLLVRGYAASDRRAVAGVSTGGFTAMSLAAQNPGRYGAVASFSGLNALAAAQPLISTLLLREGVPTTKPWGSIWFNRRTWDANDPVSSPTALRQARLFVSHGNGSPSAVDPAATGFDAIEASTLANSAVFLTTLRIRGVPVRSDLYGDGSHSWPYWERGLDRAWPELSAGLGLS